MKRSLPGGQSVFPTQTRPNIFNKLPVEELIERNGESFIWFRLMPSADEEEGDLALPDKENKGFVLSYEKERKIKDETIQLMTIQGQSFSTIYTPISSIQKLYLFRNDVHGGNQELKVRHINENKITVTDDIPIKPWYQINIDYSVRTYDTIKKEFIMSGGHIIDVGMFPNVLVKVHWVRIENGDRWELIPFTHDFLNIYLNRRYPEGTKIRVEFDIVSTIKIAYKAVDLQDVQLHDSGPIEVKAGDFEAVFSPYIEVSPGDILINTISSTIEKEIITRSNGKYRLKYSPINEIISINDGSYDYDVKNIIVEDHQYIRLLDPPRELPKRLSIVYSFHPIYKIASQITVSGQAGRLQPRKFLLRPDLTNSILSYTQNYKKYKG